MVSTVPPIPMLDEADIAPAQLAMMESSLAPITAWPLPFTVTVTSSPITVCVVFVTTSVSIMPSTAALPVEALVPTATSMIVSSASIVTLTASSPVRLTPSFISFVIVLFTTAVEITAPAAMLLPEYEMPPATSYSPSL